MNPWERETLSQLDQLAVVDRWLDSYEKRNLYKVATTDDIIDLIDACKSNPVYKNMLRNFLATETDRNTDAVELVRRVFWNRLGWRVSSNGNDIWIINRKNPYHKGK